MSAMALQICPDANVYPFNAAVAGNCPKETNSAGKAGNPVGRLVSYPLPPPVRVEPDRQAPITITPDFVADILSPYKAHARYLKTAEIASFREKASDDKGKGALAKGVGRFAIPESCYIDDTGHFNAVEFNICFNQLAYVMFAKCIEAGILQKMRCESIDVMSLPEYKRRQLPSMVIVSIESRYFKQLDSRDFRGELTIDKISSVGSAWFFFTSISFSDAEGVKAKGAVVLAYSPTFTPAR
jgi:hypothetical protein